MLSISRAPRISLSLSLSLSVCVCVLVCVCACVFGSGGGCPGLSTTRKQPLVNLDLGNDELVGFLLVFQGGVTQRPVTNMEIVVDAVVFGKFVLTTIDCATPGTNGIGVLQVRMIGGTAIGRGEAGMQE